MTGDSIVIGLERLKQGWAEVQHTVTHMIVYMGSGTLRSTAVGKLGMTQEGPPVNKL